MGIKQFAFKLMVCTLVSAPLVAAAQQPCPNPSFRNSLQGFGAELILASKRSIVGTSSGWMPLEEMGDYAGIREGYLDRIIDSNADFVCKFPSADGKLINVNTLNGWFFNGETDGFYTNAHAVINSRGQFFPFTSCHVSLRRDLISHVEAEEIPVDMNTAKYLLGLSKSGDKYEAITLRQDRARIPLLMPVRGLRTLTASPAHLKIAEGQQVIMVTTGQPFGINGMMAQTCTNMKSFDSWNRQPGGLLTDCHHMDGNSAALYFVRDTENCETKAGRKMCDLIPVALHSGSKETAADNTTWDAKTNTSMAVMIDDYFMLEPTASVALTSASAKP